MAVYQLVIVCADYLVEHQQTGVFADCGSRGALEEFFGVDGGFCALLGGEVFVEAENFIALHNFDVGHAAEDGKLAAAVIFEELAENDRAAVPSAAYR